MKLQLQAHLTDTFYGVNFVSSESCKSYSLFWALTPERDGFPWPSWCRQLGAAQEHQEGVRKPVTSRNLNYHQVKQKTWGGERKYQTSLWPPADAIPRHREILAVRSWGFPNTSKGKIHRVDRETQHAVQPSTEWAPSASLCRAVSTDTSPGLRAHHRGWAPQGASLQQLAGSSLRPPLQQKYKSKTKSRKAVYEERFIWVEVGTGCKLPWDI